MGFHWFIDSLVSLSESKLTAMEWVGKVVRKEMAGVGFSSGTVRSYDSSGFFEIVYENGFKEITELADFPALVMGEGNSQETPVQVKPRVGKCTSKPESSGRGKENWQNEVTDMRNVDLNEEVPEVSDCFGVGLRGNIDLNCGPVEPLGTGIDLNRAVLEPKKGFDWNLNEGLGLISVNFGHEENSSVKRREFIDLNMDASCDLDNAGVCDLNSHNNEGGLIDLNMDASCDLDNTGVCDLNPHNKEGGFIDLNMDASCGLDNAGVCDLNSHNKEGGFIDLNMDASGDLDNAGVCDLNPHNKEGGFDLNLEVNVENSKDDVLIQTNGNDIVQETNMQDAKGVQNNLETGECKEDHVAEVSSVQLLEEVRNQNGVSLQDVNTSNSNGAKRDLDLPVHDAKTVDESLSNTGGSRKRRKGSENPKFTSQPLRRSARIVSARFPVGRTITACLADEVSPSPSVSSLTDEDGKTENISVLPPKPQLPPSSHILNLDGLPILDVFSAYSFLRSFSTLLFLSPFELKDFVEALRCMSPSLLFDSIHVSVLHILRNHLEKLVVDGDRSAIACLRSLDWDMLDAVNYPLFVVEYLLFCGSEDKPGVDLTRFNFFRNEYFRQPMNLKIEILARLCDDMTDTEVVRSELNKIGRRTNTEVRRRKRTMMELADDSTSNDEVIDGSSVRNSDNCCLCKMDGNLLCCDGCPAAYHSKCVGVASHLLPEGNWYCPECSFDRRVPGLNLKKQIRGTECIATDPHGHSYFKNCGYLLVIDTKDTCSVNYYHANDVILVLEQLESCGSFYIGVISAIKKHWDIPVGLKRTTSGVSSQMSVCLDKPAKGMVSSVDGFKAPLPAPEKQLTSGVKKKLEERSSNGGSHNHCYRTRRKISGSATGLDILDMSSDGSAETLQNGLDVQSLHEPRPSRILDVMKEPNSNIHSSSHYLTRMYTRKGIRPNMQSESSYRNQYIFAQMTIAISEEMMRKSPIRPNDMRSDEEIASTQVKTILMKTTKFQWRNIQDLYLDAWKEKCGWCLSCKSEDAGSKTKCLFNMSLGALRGPSESEIANSPSIDKKSHLMAIICQILSMESRLQGLLVGPWLNPQHSRIWREHILNASSISSLRHLLVELEANLHHRVLSLEWLNHVDSAIEMGSSRHIIIASARSSSKTATGKRRGTLLESGVNPPAKKKGGLTMCWWRGGRLSRKLFNWKVLPRSLVSKAARQGGNRKIPGILYPENSEPAKRSRRVAWEAAVESSTTSEQLGFQVRTLHSYIKWDDIENSHLLPALDKESKKSARLFKKVIVRSKCVEEETVKYLLDFGKRRSIPDVVLKNGRLIEESSSETKKFWLNESYVPLHLVKGFEEKQAVRETSKRGGSSRHSEIDKVRKRSSKGFSYLFERAERSESSLCEQSKNDVALRGEVLAKEQPSVQKKGRPSGSFRKKVVASKPLRRSGRKREPIIRLQDECKVPAESKKRKLETERGRDRPKEVKQDISIRNKRTKGGFYVYWLDGLHLSRKPGDERVNEFQRDRDRYFRPLENSDSDHVQRKCHLCGSIDSESGSTLIACEFCKEWYHGDACGINEKNSSMVFGFRCHTCLGKLSPTCPH